MEHRPNMKIPKDIRWKMIRQLGRGGQCSVVAVSDEKGEFKGTYALKGLATGRTEKAYDRFAREINVIKKLDHSRIIKIVDNSAPTDSFHYYVMEYVEGAKTLKQLLSAHHYNPYHDNPMMAVRLFGQIVDAMIEWHKHKIVHRDLSPANILILPDYDIKVIDFGICYEDDGQMLTLLDEAVGSRNYTAPECEPGGKSGEVTIAADLYSAGKILWSAVAKRQAFAREVPVFNNEAMSQIKSDRRFWHLHHIFARTIRHAVADRFGTPSEAAHVTEHVGRLIESRRPPLEEFADRQICPLCSWGKLTSFELSHMVFGNPNPPNFAAVRCTYCGFSFAIDGGVIKANIEKAASLS